MNRYIILIVAIAAGGISACFWRGAPIRTVVPIASVQHNCPKENIQFEEAGPNQVVVSGCDQQWLYRRKCNKCPWEQDIYSGPAAQH
jgi:hypothetical protein